VRTKFVDARFSHSRDLIASVEIEHGSSDSDHAPFRGGFNSTGLLSIH